MQHLNNLRHIFLKSVESVRPVNLLGLTNSDYCLRPQLTDDGRDIYIYIQGKTLNITKKRCHIVGFGKAVLGMAVQLELALSHKLAGGLLSVPTGTLQQFARDPEMQLKKNSCISVMEGAFNNQPDENAVQAAKLIKDMAVNMTENDVLFVLISGGGSALLPLPRAPLILKEKMQLVRLLQNCGARIDEINIVRIALSNIKGGELAKAARHAHAVISFVISDVVGDPVDLIASGPTCVTTHKRCTAKEILHKYKMWAELPQHWREVIETTSPKEEMKLSSNNTIYIVGHNRVATAMAVQEALHCGYNPFVASTVVQGEVTELVNLYKVFLQNVLLFRSKKLNEKQLREQFPFDANIFQNFVETLHNWQISGKPLLLILAGEPTVKITGNGLGGRNQELALRMSVELYQNSAFEDIIFLSGGTDGQDGPTPAAGAFGCSMMVQQYLCDQANNVDDIKTYARNNDSYNFYKKESGQYHIVTGYTGTNVMDLQFILMP